MYLINRNMLLAYFRCSFIINNIIILLIYSQIVLQTLFSFQFTERMNERKSVKVKRRMVDVGHANVKQRLQCCVALLHDSWLGSLTINGYNNNAYSFAQQKYMRTLSFSLLYISTYIQQSLPHGKYSEWKPIVFETIQTKHLICVDYQSFVCFPCFLVEFSTFPMSYLNQILCVSVCVCVWYVSALYGLCVGQYGNKQSKEDPLKRMTHSVGMEMLSIMIFKCISSLPLLLCCGWIRQYEFCTRISNLVDG